MTMYDSQDDHDACQTVQILPMIKIILTDGKKNKKNCETNTGDLAAAFASQISALQDISLWGLDGILESDL